MQHQFRLIGIREGAGQAEVQEAGIAIYSY